MTDDRICPNQTTNGETMNIPNTLPTLSAGSHRPGDGKACVMEYVSLLAGEEWSDTPTCTYRPLAKAAQFVNDRLSDDNRHLLVPLIGRLFGTTLPVDDRVFALRVARTVEYLSPAAETCNDVVEKFLAGEATQDEVVKARDAAYVAHGYAYATNAAASTLATYAATSAYTHAAATHAATSAAHAYAYAVDDDAAVGDEADHKATQLVAWLESLIDIYDELSGRTENREINGGELAELALAVQR